MIMKKSQKSDLQDNSKFKILGVKKTWNNPKLETTELKGLKFNIKNEILSEVKTNGKQPDAVTSEKNSENKPGVGGEPLKKKKSKLLKLKAKKRKMKKLGLKSKVKTPVKPNVKTQEHKIKRTEKNIKTNKSIKVQSLVKNVKEEHPAKKTVMSDLKKDKLALIAKQTEQKRLKDSQILLQVKERIEKRDCCKLYIKGNLKKLQLSELLSLAPGICDAHKLALDANFAFLEFKSPKLAEKGFKLLQEKKDLVVKKWKSQTNYVKDVKFSHNTLSVEGIPSDTQAADLKVLFPTSLSIVIPSNKGFRCLSYAHIKFLNEADAKTSFFESANFNIKGYPVTVVYAKLKSKLKIRGKTKKKTKKKNKSKVVK